MYGAGQMTGTLFVGAILVGIGIGMIFGNVGAGAVIGTGVGFILMGITAPMNRVMKRVLDKEGL
jgi:hypothetical protein